MAILLLKQQEVPYYLLLPILSLLQTRNKILGEIIVLGVSHRQTAPLALKTASQTDAD